MTPDIKPVFVFGSNLAGRHGAGAALDAVNEYGAIWGQGKGLQGNSYAIPTKDRDLNTLPLAMIHVYVREFLDFAKRTPDTLYQVTAIGCGFAGYEPSDIAPMFMLAPPNCLLDPRFIAVIDKIRAESKQAV